MLGARTKQVYSYGKRNQRIVNVSEERDRRKVIPNIFDDVEPPPQWAPVASKMKRREKSEPGKAKTPSPRVIRINKKKRLSPVLTPAKKRTRVAQIIAAEAHKREQPALSKPKTLGLKQSSPTTPPRAPLAHFSLNIPGSPTVSAKPRSTRAREIPLIKATPLKLNKPFSPFVDVDIIILDDEGKTVRSERRVSRTDVDVNPINQFTAKRLMFDGSDDDDIQEIEPPKQPKRSSRRAVITVYSDDSESENEVTTESPRASTLKSTTSRSSQAGPSRTMVEVVIPPAPYRVKPMNKTSLPSSSHGISPPHATLPPLPQLVQQPRYQNIPSPVARPRQLTPIRRGRGKALFEPPSPPSPFTSTDFDLSLDFEGLSIAGSSIHNTTYRPEIEFPVYLQPLLEECHQENCGPIEFSSFIETFPFDQVVRSEETPFGDYSFRKIGEASYSEVFGIGNVVLKVIPLRDETARETTLDHPRPNAKHNEDEEDGPAPSDAKDVLKEIIVTGAMGEVCDGFVKLLKTYIVKGRYPEVLLGLWDEYHASKGSESVRPDKFAVSQIYAIIVLPNGGPDLEAYKFVNASKMGWRQACSLFWQVAKSLAHAEQLVSFEHRDLHWGQILVKNLPVSTAMPLRTRNQNSRAAPPSSRLWMDDFGHGIRATLIDLGLSRMDAGDGAGGEMTHWTPFEDEVFMGEGDYQFDVYRIMREHTGGAWEDFKPLTNVMWLHYLTLKLLNSKRLKPPPTSRAPSSTDTAAFTEKDCFDCLVDIERWLGNCVAAVAPKAAPKAKGRKKNQAPPKPTTPIGPSCAGEIIAYAVKKGWVRSI